MMFALCWLPANAWRHGRLCHRVNAAASCIPFKRPNGLRRGARAFRICAPYWEPLTDRSFLATCRIHRLQIVFTATFYQEHAATGFVSIFTKKIAAQINVQRSERSKISGYAYLRRPKASMPQTNAAPKAAAIGNSVCTWAEPVVCAKACALMTMIETVAINCFIVAAPFLVSMEDGAVCPNGNRGNSN